MAAQQAIDAKAADQVTTFMFRGIPRKYTAWDLVTVLERSATREQFDFVYVPWYKNSNSNMGYAFVNFVDDMTARAVYDVMQGSQWGAAHGSRSMNLVPAQVQGLAENLQQYNLKNGSDFDLIHRPLIFNNGAQMDLHETVNRFCNCSRSQSEVSSSPTTPKTPPSARAAKAREAKNIMAPPGLEIPSLSDAEACEAKNIMAPPGLANPPLSAPGGFCNYVAAPHGNLELVQKKAPLSDGARAPIPTGLQPLNTVHEDGANAHSASMSPGGSLGCPVLLPQAQHGFAPAVTTGNTEVEPKYVHLGQRSVTDKSKYNLRHLSNTGCFEVACGSGTGKTVGTLRDVSPACFGSGTSADSRRSTVCPTGFSSEGSADASSIADDILESPGYAAAWQQVDTLLKKLQAGGATFRKPDVSLYQ